jgi:hypothetical protein
MKHTGIVKGAVVGGIGVAGWLLDRIMQQPVLAVPDGIEVTERWQGARRILFVLNHMG